MSTENDSVNGESVQQKKGQMISVQHFILFQNLMKMCGDDPDMAEPCANILVLTDEQQLTLWMQICNRIHTNAPGKKVMASAGHTLVLEPIRPSMQTRTEAVDTRLWRGKRGQPMPPEVRAQAEQCLRDGDSNYQVYKKYGIAHPQAELMRKRLGLVLSKVPSEPGKLSDYDIRQWRGERGKPMPMEVRDYIKNLLAQGKPTPFLMSKFRISYDTITAMKRELDAPKIAAIEAKSADATKMPPWALARGGE